VELAFPTTEQVMSRLTAWRVQYPALEALLMRYGAVPLALRHLGLSLWQTRDLEGATPILIGAAVLSPDEAPFWSSVGGVLFACGNNAPAAACLRRALDLDPSKANDWLLLASALNGEPDRGPAEHAFLRASELDPNLSDAALGLGLLYMQTRRFAEAAHYLGVVASKSDNASVQSCLGQVLSNLGDFGAAATAFGAAVRYRPDDADLRQKWGQARFIETLAQNASFEEGVAAYEAAAGHRARDPERLMRDGFHLLGGYGHVEAAIRLGERRDRENPGDPIVQYLLRALRGEPALRAPDDYISVYFDKFADTFDNQLVEVLGYRGHEQLNALVARRHRTFNRILDLGCGTGLAGPLLKKPGTHLTGIDLSPGMLRKAEDRAVYDELIVAEAVDYLACQTHAFDLIFAADVLIYIGDLGPLLRNAAGVIAPGSLLAFSIETTSERPYAFLPSGRFAHHTLDLEDLARGAFKMIEMEATTIRLEANQPVAGAFLLYERI
jgi:predicted TPR repeat methyltransferase